MGKYNDVMEEKSNLEQITYEISFKGTTINVILYAQKFIASWRVREYINREVDPQDFIKSNPCHQNV